MTELYWQAVEAEHRAEKAEARVAELERERDGWKSAAESQNRQWSAKCTQLTEVRAELDSRIAELEAAARELVRWDWDHLLVDHPDSEQVIVNARNLERALKEPDPVAQALAALGEAAVAVWLEPDSYEREGELRFAIDAYARARKGER